MFYCYMNDENCEPIISVLFDQKMWFMFYPPAHITCVSTYCCLPSTQYKVPRLFVRIFVGRPRFVVYPPRPICNHDYLYVCY